MTLINFDTNRINEASMEFYKEYVEGEPLDQDTPHECFFAGAEFILRELEKEGKICNLLKNNSYNNIIIKKGMDKLTEKLSKMIHIKGFKIIMYPDPEINVSKLVWEINGDHYFDSLEELHYFKIGLEELYTSYLGDIEIKEIN